MLEKPRTGPFRQNNLPGKMLYVLFLAEIFLLTFLRNKLGEWISPVVFYGVSVAFCGGAFYYFLERPYPSLQSLGGAPRKWTTLFVAGAGIIMAHFFFKGITKAYPIDQASSDIIPSLQIYVHRFLSGQYVYTTFTELNYPLFPTYLPGFWVPFTVAEWLHWDYRKLAFGGFVLGCLAYLLVALRLRLTFHELLWKGILPFLVFISFCQTEDHVIGNTVETLIYGFYFLLVASLTGKSWVWRAATILLCLLSRYVLVFWLPLYLLLVYLEDDKRKAWRITGFLVAGVLAFYVLPFMTVDSTIFLKAQASYANAALGEWQHLDQNNQPMHLFRGMGFALYFYQWAPGALAEKITLIRVVHLAVSVGAVLFSGWLYRRFRSRIDYRLFAILSLKFYLVTFYAFIQVPYSYLLALGVFISLFVLLFIRPEETNPEPIVVH